MRKRKEKISYFVVRSNEKPTQREERSCKIDRTAQYSLPCPCLFPNPTHPPIHPWYVAQKITVLPKETPSFRIHPNQFNWMSQRTPQSSPSLYQPTNRKIIFNYKPTSSSDSPAHPQSRTPYSARAPTSDHHAKASPAQARTHCAPRANR